MRNLCGHVKTKTALERLDDEAKSAQSTWRTLNPRPEADRDELLLAGRRTAESRPWLPRLLDQQDQLFVVDRDNRCRCRRERSSRRAPAIRTAARQRTVIPRSQWQRVVSCHPFGRTSFANRHRVAPGSATADKQVVATTGNRGGGIHRNGTQKHGSHIHRRFESAFGDGPIHEIGYKSRIGNVVVGIQNHERRRTD